MQPLLTPLTKFWGQLIYGIDADEVVPEKAVKGVQTPIFIIHSRQDETTLVENAEILRESLKDNKNAQVWIYERGRHGELGGSEYQQKILEFLEEHL